MVARRNPKCKAVEGCDGEPIRKIKKGSGL